MDNAHRVRFAHGRARLEQVAHSVGDRQRPNALAKVGEIRAVEAFHDHVGHAGRQRVDVGHTDDVVILDLGRSARLAGKTLDHTGDLHHRRQQHFDRDRLVEAEVTGREHQAHSALTKHLLDTVFAGEDAAR